MTFRRTCSDDVDTNGEGSFGNFLRSLLAGVPWSERAEREEVLHIPRAANKSFRLYNANGRTRVFTTRTCSIRGWSRSRLTNCASVE